MWQSVHTSLEASRSFLFSINFKHSSEDRAVVLTELGWHKISKIKPIRLVYYFSKNIWLQL